MQAAKLPKQSRKLELLPDPLVDSSDNPKLDPLVPESLLGMDNGRPDEPQRGPKTKRSISIGTKFLGLILATLLMAVSIIVYNATHLFQKDNLNNIYVASDLLTSAKAGETRAWISSIIQKANLVGKILVTQKSQATVHGNSFLKTFENDSDILAVSLYRKGGAGTFSPKLAWFNPTLTKQINVSEKQLTDLRATWQIPYNKVAAGAIHAFSHIMADGQPLLILNIPFVQQSPGYFSAFLSVITRQEKLTASFADGGAYTLALVDNEGRLLAHPDLNRVKDKESLAALPIVKKMLESPLEREFQEFDFGHVRYLGAYAKVGIAGMGVISQVPRSRAFEAGQTLIRRSVLIAVLVLSVAYIIAYFFAQTLVSPIRRLSQATEQIAHGNFNVRVQVSTSDEIASLASSFNSMSGEIERKIQNLSKINESSKVISSTLEAQKLMSFTLETLLGLLHAKSGVAWLWKNGSKTAEGGKPELGTFVLRGWGSEQLAANDPLLQQAAKISQPSIITLDGFSALVVPIQEKAGVMGFAVLKNREDAKAFSDEDLFMAGTIMTSVGITFENIDLLKKTADNARMEKELETAKLVQDTMFPPSQIVLPHLEIESYYTPASECGGDWWGILLLPDDKVLFAIGDATGHGVPAAMVTATAKAACSVIHRISAEVPQIATNPAMVLHFLNKAVYESTLGKILMTFFVAVVDTKSGEVTYATASHDPIYWYKTPSDATPENGSKENIDALVGIPGPRLGQDPVSEYENSTIQLNPKDVIVLYTDGLPEGKNPGGSDEYGERKFLRSIGKHAHEVPSAMRDGILEDFHGFVQDEPLHDDVTLVICKYDPAITG